jgi:large subunit ribosomal protein L19
MFRTSLLGGYSTTATGNGVVAIGGSFSHIKQPLLVFVCVPVIMLRSLIAPACRPALNAVQKPAFCAAFFSSNSNVVDHGIDPEDMPFLHHGSRPRFRDYTKFKSPRKRASNMMHELTTQKMQQSKEGNPAVWDTKFRVGDAIEIQLVSQGGASSKAYEKVRGVVLGIFKKGLDHSVLIRDVVFGEPLERRIPLHSPLIKSVKILEENFVFKGRRKIKRAKLYYLSERNPIGKFLSEPIVCFLFCLSSNALLLLQILRDPRNQVIKMNSIIALKRTLHNSSLVTLINLNSSKVRVSRSCFHVIYLACSGSRGVAAVGCCIAGISIGITISAPLVVSASVFAAWLSRVTPSSITMGC